MRDVDGDWTSLSNARFATIEKGWLGGMSQIAEGGEGSRCVTGWKYKQESSAGFSIPLPISLSLGLPDKLKYLE